MTDGSTRSSPVTIFDVAAEAGVSTATVSRVANGHPNIREETRVRVQEAMTRLGYVANLRARGLAGGKTNVIGLLVDDLESSYITQIVRGVDGAVFERGYGVMLTTTHQRAGRGPRHLAPLFNGLADGVIVLFATGFETYVVEATEYGYPIVIVDHDPGPAAPVINTANEEGARRAVEHLIDLGHRRIGIITGEQDIASARQRLQGYRSALHAAGLPADDRLVAEANFLVEGGARATDHLLDLEDPPTAIFASSDTEAFGAMLTISQRGLSIPGDVSLVGFDDIPEASYVTPALTTVRQPMHEMGRLAAETLADTMANPDQPPPAIELPTELVIRASTAPISA
jgi:LacI family transcriptional regulator